MADFYSQTRKRKLLRKLRLQARLTRRKFKDLKIPFNMPALPNELVSRIVEFMDGATAVCFVLTSLNSYGVVTETKKTPLYTMYPAYTGGPYVDTGSFTRHERFVRLLWTRFGGCVYCGEKQKDSKLYKQGQKEYTVYVCRAWLQRELSLLPVNSYMTLAEHQSSGMRSLIQKLNSMVKNLDVVERRAKVLEFERERNTFLSQYVDLALNRQAFVLCLGHLMKI